ncbi:MAG: hypothetical protein ACI83Q_000786 [Colwellia polaris]|jgi:hypothetical protein
MADYEPGVCNIDKSGQRKRYILGVSGLASGFLLSTASFITSVSDLIFFGVAALLFIGFEGLFQGYESFCVAHASKGTYSEDGREENVEGEESHIKDLEKAKKIHLKSIAAAAFTTAVLYLIQI